MIREPVIIYEYDCSLTHRVDIRKDKPYGIVKYTLSYDCHNIQFFNLDWVDRYKTLEALTDAWLHRKNQTCHAKSADFHYIYQPVKIKYTND